MKKKKSSYSVKLIWQLIKHGLILQGIRYAFAKIGLDIMPYYWVQEEASLSEKPIIKSDSQDFIFFSLNSEDIKLILDKSDSLNSKKILQSLDYKQECVGLKYDNEIAAYMFIELNDFIFKNRTFKMKENEAYLLNMFTFESFRGKNLAPYLRYHCYRYLENRNITVKYSISNYFNKSAIKFKKKLNSKHLILYFNIELFKKFQWHFVLKRFK
ncbi:GNAT family N-acetyltransferase [bacterium AH-315-P13]|nr:GNAT family N-acetyltransferase [bacterium AH-315-P13]MBN4085149.1 GNAT family N-acetyltransferase [Flavobacteriaceae bacterium AH-315-B10]